MKESGSINHGLTFQNYLIKEYQRRKKNNSSYSLRAFARDLDIDQSLLSKSLKGTKDFNWKTIEDCLKILSAPPEVMAYFKEKKHNFTSDFSPLEESIILAMSDWKYWAILEFFKIDESPTPEKIAKKFKLPIKEVINILTILENLEFIKQVKGKYKLLKPNNSWVDNKNTSNARKELQKKLALKSYESIDQISVDKRHHCSLTVAIDKEKIPEFKEKINSFVAKFGKFSQKKSEIDEVYQLSVGFFPLTDIKD
jgi:DNA-binding MarR family transcriptional regulator